MEKIPTEKEIYRNIQALLDSIGHMTFAEYDINHIELSNKLDKAIEALIAKKMEEVEQKAEEKGYLEGYNVAKEKYQVRYKIKGGSTTGFSTLGMQINN